MAIAVALYRLVTGAVQARMTPTAVLNVRWILPAVGGILANGLGAGTLSVGAALPAMGAVVVGLVVVDRMAPGLHRTLTRLNSADASRFPPA